MDLQEGCKISEAQCPIFNYGHNNYFETVAWHGIGCSFVSLFGSLIIIVTYFLFALYKFPPFRVILFLTFADLVYSVQKMILWDKRINLFDKSRCFSQAFLETWASFSQLGWTLVIAIMIFSQNVQKKIPAEIFSKSRWFLYLSIGFGIPTVLAFPGLFFAYNPDEYWCWIKNPRSRIVCNPLFHKYYENHCDSASIGLIIFFLVLTWAVILTNATFYFIIIFYRYKQTQPVDRTQSEIRRSSLNLLAFPIVQVIIWLFPTINRVYSLTSQEQEFPWLAIFQVSLLSLQGAANSIIYGLNPIVRQRIRYLIKYRRLRSITTQEFEPFIDSDENSERNE